MSLYQGGSEEAFKEIYTRHSGKIFGYLRRRCTNEQELRDLFQEVFVKIHKSKHLYKDTLPLLPWIFSIAHSVMIDGKRKAKRTNEVFGLDSNSGTSIDSQQSHVNFEEPIRGLSERDQMILKLKYFEEKTFVEIAEQLKSSPVTIRKIVSRGIAKLRKVLEKEGSYG
jgi:RNA polymerase sigma-70 factor (ECF subfamily)